MASAVMEALERDKRINGDDLFRGSAQRPWRKMFFRALAEHGVIKVAAEIAGVHPAYITRCKRDQPRFARRFERAMLQYRASATEEMDAELRSVAKDGYRETINGPNGLFVKHRRSVPALLGYLGAHHPAYRKQATGNTTTTHIVNVNAHQLFLSQDPAVRAAVRVIDAARSSPAQASAVPQPLALASPQGETPA